MRAHLTDDPGCFLARDWSALVDADPEGTFFHTPQYLKTWWEEFGRAGGLRLAFVEDAGVDVAFCGFELRDRTLWFLGGQDVTDYMGPVARPGSEERVAKELVRAVLQEDWKRADLAGLPSDGRWIGHLAAAAEEAGLRVERGEDGVTPLVDLPASFEAYEASLSSKLRHEMRRKRRRLERETGAFDVVRATQDDAEALLDRFFELHRQSRGRKGRFMHPGMELFFRHLADDFLPGPFRLEFLRANGELMAGVVAFRFAESLCLYNSAFDHRYASLAPGMVLIAEMIARAIDEGVARFDLLKGDLPYKYRFGAHARRVERLLLSR